MSSSTCEICANESARYTCPKCTKRTCSVPCIKTHKLQDECSGTADDPTNYVPREKLKGADTADETNILVQRDYNFLMGVNRHLELLKRDGKTRNKRALVPAQGHGYQAHLKKRQQLEQPPKVIRRGVHCILLPKGMQRSLQNKSKWDKSLDLFVWSLEWCLFSPQGTIELFHTSHRNKETDTLVECMGKIVQTKCCELFNDKDKEAPKLQEIEQSIDTHQFLGIQDPEKPKQTIEAQNSLELEEQQQNPESQQKPEIQENDMQIRLNWLSELGLNLYTKCFPQDAEPFTDSRKLIQLDPTKPIGELFRDRTVIEYPTIFVAQGDSSLCAGYSLVGQASSSEVENDASSDDDCSETSSSSESDSSDSENPSNTDEEPDETSSKPPLITSVTGSSSINQKEDEDDHDDDEDDYTPGISLDFLAD